VTDLLAVHEAETPSESTETVSDEDVGQTTESEHAERDLGGDDDVETLEMMFQRVSTCWTSDERRQSVTCCCKK
jgi:hypothetical protein